MLTDAVVVMVGGALGSILRAWGLWALGPAAGGVPWVTAGGNIGGAFALGAAAAVLAAGTSRSARFRLFLTTGVLGSFTTFSALAVDTILLASSGRPDAAGSYLVVSVGGGLLAAVAGMQVGRAVMEAP